MRFSFGIAIPAVRSGWVGLKEGIHAQRICPFCDLPWISIAALSFLGRSCLLHNPQPPPASFLDGEPERVCHCPYCVRFRNHRLAA